MRVSRMAAMTVKLLVADDHAIVREGYRSLLGKHFRYYSYGTIVTALAFGIVTSLQIPQLAANEPTPWMGLTERVDIYAMMLWMAALAVGLWRAQETVATPHLVKPAATPQRALGVPR